MSAFLSSPARTSILLERSTQDPAHSGGSKCYTTGPPMYEQSQMGARSPASGCPPEASLQESSDRRGGEPARSSGVSAENEGGDAAARERSSLDGGSVDQRSLAMSMMEFFDAEEALESASDISTQPDDSLGLRERLQNEIRLRVLAQEALAALHAERSELLGQLKNAEASRPNDGEDAAEVSGRKANDTSHSESDEVQPREEVSPRAADLSQHPGGELATERKDETNPPAEVRGEHAKSKQEQIEPGIISGASDESENRIPEPANDEAGAHIRMNQEPASSGGEDLNVGPSAGDGGEAELEVLREAVGRRDVEIARLKEKLDYWERVNEEYRVQREDAKEKKREARRRLRRTRDWTVGLLSASVGLCIIGGAAYGAYRYWQGAPLFSGLNVQGETQTRQTSGASTAALEEGAPSRATVE